MPERITIHARKAHTKTLGTTYVGYIRIQTYCTDLRREVSWPQSSDIHRLTRAEALDDAQELRDAALLDHR